MALAKTKLKRKEERPADEAEECASVKRARGIARPKDGVALFFLSHIERVFQSDELRAEHPSDHATQVFKIPTTMLSDDELFHLENYCVLSKEMAAAQVWIDLARRLGVYYDKDEAYDKEAEDRWVKESGGCLKKYELKEVKGSLVNKGEIFTHVFCVEC